MDLPESSVRRRVGPVDREELVRVIEESLYSLGYRRAAAELEAESGVPLYPPEHDRLLLDVMAGRWDACAETVRSVAGVGDADRAVAEFLLWRGHYLELLGTGGDAGLRRAREVLRRRIAPLAVDRRCVHWLACAMVSCEGAVAPDAVVGWRIAVFLDLVEVLPPWFHVPTGRLEHLVESAVTKQVASCIYHNLPDEITMLEDHKCHEQHIPSECAQILCGHNNEVWFVRFSNNGDYLASSSSDCTAIIWKGHHKPISFVAWSPNDRMLLTCGTGEFLKLWNVDTGECNLKFRGSADYIISSCAWFPNSEKIVCASSEPGSSPNRIFTCDLEGQELEVWAGDRIPKVSDLAVTPDGRHLIFVSCNDIWIRELPKGREWRFREKQAISSLSLSGDGQSLIVNLSSQEIHLWKINESSTVPEKFKGHKQEKFVIRSCFGGSNSLFIASGSEDSQVYIWKRHLETPIKVLHGHTMIVNCVSWNPARPHMLASASDDRTVRIWLARKPGSTCS
uniref:CTLH domain-containing protein n=1 Tax=Setaria italica TaxID=4555 RepID=K4A8S6_SETIT